MKPDTTSPGGDLSAPHPAHQPAAADIIRTQLDDLYDKQAATSEHTYERTHEPHPQPQADQWQAYHTAWQNYYQQYYQGYYEAQHRAKAPGQQYFTQPEPETTSASFEPQGAISQDAALADLRNQLLHKVQTSAHRVRRSRHFVPIVAALAVMSVFLFLQYNRVLIASVQAYVSPGAISPQNIVIDPSGDVSVSADPRLIIPKINVDVPVIYDVGVDYDSQMSAMEKGIAHFAIPGASSHPGEAGNTVLSGHSSNDLFDPGDYKFIFAQLEKLSVGDTIYAHYKGTRYTYLVSKTEVVKPTEVGKLVTDGKKPVLTLITCTPLGTSLDRLLVTAEQISPDPGKATAAPDATGQDNSTIPGSSPTLLERLFGIR